MAEGGLDLFAMAAALSGETDSTTEPRPLTTDELKQLASEPEMNTVRRSLTPVAFGEHYESCGLPVVLEGCCDAWGCMDWTPASLAEKFGNEEFALFNGQRFALSEYLSYMEGRGEDDARPLYLFEDLSLVKDSEAKAALLQQYSVPEHFAGRDLFELCAADPERPRFRWLLLGPARSGSMVHVDPHGTSAWNALLRGTKRWVLLPPETKAESIKPELSPSVCCAADWFERVLPRLRSEPETAGRIVEFTQRRGETVFVPAGWWHVVVNCDNALAASNCSACVAVEVTQNFASATNLEGVWRATKAASPAFAARWLGALRDALPELAIRICNCCESVQWPPFAESVFAASPVRKQALWAADAAEEACWVATAGNLYEAERRSRIGGGGRQNPCIPRIVHHIWLGGSALPARFVALRETWRKFNPDWEHRLWTDAQVEALGLRNAALFAAASNFGERSDIARYEILHRFGGVYVDVDFECLRPFDELFATNGAGSEGGEPITFAAGFASVGAVELNNGLIAATPGHEILTELMEAVSLSSSSSSSSAVAASDGAAAACHGTQARAPLPSGAVALVREMIGGAGDGQGGAAPALRALRQGSGGVFHDATSTIERTGPGLFTRVVLQHAARRQCVPEHGGGGGVVIFPQRFFFAVPNSATSCESDGEAWAAAKRQYAKPESFAVHLWARTWQQDQCHTEPSRPRASEGAGHASRGNKAWAADELD